MAGNEPSIQVRINGDVTGQLTIGGRDVTVWQAAQEHNILPQQIGRMVFVNYASDDRETYARPLVEHLIAAGYRVWFDQTAIPGGADWQKEIREGIRRCEAFLALITDESIKPEHEWVRYEHKIARQQFAPVIPVWVQRRDVPLPDGFGDLQVVDLTDLDDEVAFNDLQKAIERVVRKPGRFLIDQTPGVTRTFIGRQAELEAVYERLGNDETLAVTAVQGIGGIGKTMLIEELARRLRYRYPGGVIVEKRGPERAERDPVDAVLRRWYREATGQEVEGVRLQDVQTALSQYGELLVIIDDVWPGDFNDVKTLLEALPTDAERLLTTRFNNEARAIGAEVYELVRLSLEDGVAFLEDRLKSAQGPPPERDLLERLVEAVQGHALALEVTAGSVQNTARLAVRVEDLEARLAAGDLSVVAAEIAEQTKDSSVAVSLDLSYEWLEENNPDLSACFTMLGAFAEDAPFDADAAAAVWEVDEGVAADELDRLVGYGLAAVTEDGRYRQHILLRSYALGRLRQDNEHLGVAVSLHFLHYAAVAASLTQENWREVDTCVENIAHAAERVCDALGDDLVAVLSEPQMPDDLPTNQWCGFEINTRISQAVSDKPTANGGPREYQRFYHTSVLQSGR